MELTLVHLYPELMNIYGDLGNIIALKKRAEWRGINIEVVNVSIGDKLPDKVNLYFMGGGQDQAQFDLAKDLRSKSEKVKADIETLLHKGQRFITTGTRSSDMALRLKYAGVKEEDVVDEADLGEALLKIQKVGSEQIFCLLTYTALLGFREILAKKGLVKPFFED